MTRTSLLHFLAAASVAGCGGIATTEDDGGGGDGRDADRGAEVRDEGGAGDATDDGATDSPAFCGNGLVEPPEECDDGDTTDGDGCETDCSYTCTSWHDCADTEECNGAENCGPDYVCVPGTALADRTPCTLAAGGDGVCRSGSCVTANCGNGVLDSGEACDDGDTDNSDACLTTCLEASCNDGFVWEGVEACDGAPAACITACGTDGLQHCNPDCSLMEDCTPPREVCNGLDEDCYGGPDNGFPCSVGATRSTIVEGCNLDENCSESCEWLQRWSPEADNDTCAAAQPLPVPSTDSVTTIEDLLCGAEDDVALECATSRAGVEVLFSFELTQPRVVTIDTVGSTFDTILRLGSGTPCPGVLVACNDDDPAAEGGASSLRAVLDPGTYFVALEGAGGARGSYTLHLAASPVAANDECATAAELPISHTAQVERGTTADATDDGLRCTSTPAAGPDVWYSFRMVGPQLVYFDLFDGEAWQGTLRLYDRCPSAAGAPLLACAGPSCGETRPQLALTLPADGIGGTTYYLAVDGATMTDAGTFELRHFAPGPLCSGAADGRLELGIDTTGSIPGTGLSRLASTCGGGTGVEDIYYLTLCPEQTLLASTCAACTFRSFLYLYQNGCGLGTSPGTQVACSSTATASCFAPGGAEFEFGAGGAPSIGPGLYFLVVDSSGISPTSSGTYTLRLSVVP